MRVESKESRILGRRALQSSRATQEKGCRRRIERILLNYSVAVQKWCIEMKYEKAKVKARGQQKPNDEIGTKLM